MLIYKLPPLFIPENLLPKESCVIRTRVDSGFLVEGRQVCELCSKGMTGKINDSLLP